MLLEGEAWLARRGGRKGCALAGEERICRREGLLEVLVVGATRDMSVKVQGCEGGLWFALVHLGKLSLSEMCGAPANGQEGWVLLWHTWLGR